MATWYERNKQRARENGRRWERENYDKRHAKMLRWRDENPEAAQVHRRRFYQKLRADPVRSAHRSEKLRAANLRRRYGLSTEQFDAMLSTQGGACGGCKKQFIKIPQVDHDHETGVVRGLLCSSCNKALGHVSDDADRLRRLATVYATTWCVVQLEPRVKYRPGNSKANLKALFNRFGEKCMSCGGLDRLVVDHDHKTRLVRGVLCHGCNAAFGFMNEDPVLILLLCDYIEAHKRSRGS